MALKRSVAVLGVIAVATCILAENEPIPEPDCDDTKTVRVRYSTNSSRLYLEAGVEGERGGCATLSQIYQIRAGKAPLYPMDPDSGGRALNPTRVWLLTDSLFVEDGITLNVHGGTNGDCDELRLLSDVDTVISMRAHGGSLSFHDTKVVSWDERAGTYDTNVDDGRSYISVISEVKDEQTCLGAAKRNMGEARMDIVSSEMAYLGYYNSESYGLTWKVRGFCQDKSNPEVFDNVDVYGNIYDSDIHHNYFGVYTYGHQQGDWRRNMMHDNIQYGFDPHDDSDYINIVDNEVWDNGNHGIIASKRCNHVVISDNEVYGGGQAGLFLHRSTDNATVTRNYVYDNADAGLALMESFHADVRDNVFENNLYGIRMSVGCGYNLFEDNQVTDSTKYNFYTYEGSDKPFVVGTGRSFDNRFVNNIVSGSPETIKLKESDRIVFQGNTFSNETTTIRFDNSTEMLMIDNKGLESAILKVAGGACFDAASDSGFTPTC